MNAIRLQNVSGLRWHKREISHDVMNMKIKPIENDEPNLKLTHNNERISVGWFYVTKDILRITTEHFPGWIKTYIEMIQAMIEEDRGLI